jgi:hypothetical protein
LLLVSVSLYFSTFGPRGETRMDRLMRLSCGLAAAMAALVVTTVGAVAGGVADSEAARVTSDAVRAQGYPCKEPVAAERDQSASKPDEEVWILQCADAHYRVRLRGDVPAKVERLD